jgi:DNA-binding response OmpR family regulator
MKKKLLWLEDDALLGQILGKSLQATEFELIHVKTGSEAVSFLSKTVPDVIMVDLLVPGEIDGFGVLEFVQKNAQLNKVPRIVLSNLSNQADIDRARSLGANTFIVKASSSIDLIIGEIRNQTAGK